MALRCIRADHALTDLVTQPRPHVHCLIVPRPREYHPNVPEETADETSDAGAVGVSGTGPTDASGRRFNRRATDRTLPRWVVPAVVVFWLGYVLTFTTRHVFHRLSSLLLLILVAIFLSLAIEPGVNRLAARGWRRGRATIMILLGVLAAFLIFVGAVGTLVGTQVADLLADSDRTSPTRSTSSTTTSAPTSIHRTSSRSSTIPTAGCRSSSSHRATKRCGCRWPWSV